MARADDALKVFSLYSGDVEGANEAYSQYLQFRTRKNPVENGKLMFYASMFVCAVRRTGRILESMSGSHASFRPDTAETIRLEWRKKRTFYQDFVDPRNAIEHIDNEARDETKWRFFNLTDDRLEITNDIAVSIDGAALSKVTESWERIARSIVSEYENPLSNQLQNL